MASQRIEAMRELARRGKLPDDLKPYFDEAVKRGIVAAPVASLKGVVDPAGSSGEVSGNIERPNSYDESYVAQGLSGVNEGLANLAGAPVDLTAAAMNAGIDTLNNNVGTSIPRIEDPVGGSKMFKDYLAPTIKPETSDPGKQFVRRVGEEVGAALVPGMGIAGKVEKPLAALGNTLASAVGSGAGAAIAEQVAPDNAIAEFAGQLIGGLGPGLVGASLRKALANKTGPSALELQSLKNDAYKATETLGVKYSPKSYQRMVLDVDGAVKADNISVTRHPKAASFVEDMKTRFKEGMTLTEIDQLRQEVRRDLLRNSDEAEQHFGKLIVRKIDDFIAKAGPGDVVAGDAKTASEAIVAARELNTRFRKTELLEDALYRADLKTASTGSGGNINNNLRSEIRRILLDEGDRRAFSAAEISAMEKLVKPGVGEELLRRVGKLSPEGNGLTMLLHLLGTAANPLWAAVPAAGFAAKRLADGAALGKAAKLRADVARGGHLKAPLLSDPERAGGAALTVGIAANQNEKRAAGAALKARVQ